MGVFDTMKGGIAQALRAEIEKTAAARGLVLSEAGRARLGEINDTNVLTKWRDQARTAQQESDIFSLAW